MKRRKLLPGDIVADSTKTLGMVMRDDDELLVAYPGLDELTIERAGDLKRKGNIKQIEGKN